MALLVDRGAILALADRRDAWHTRVSSFLASRREILVVPAPVLPEAAYLLRKFLGPKEELALVISVAKGEVAVEVLEPADYQRCSQLMTQYDQIGFVDSSVVAVAERLGLARLLTTDRRHFSIVRPRHVAALTLVP